MIYNATSTVFCVALPLPLICAVFSQEASSPPPSNPPISLIIQFLPPVLKLIYKWRRSYDVWTAARLYLLPFLPYISYFTQCCVKWEKNCLHHLSVSVFFNSFLLVIRSASAGSLNRHRLNSLKVPCATHRFICTVMESRNLLCIEYDILAEEAAMDFSFRSGLLQLIWFTHSNPDSRIHWQIICDLGPYTTPSYCMTSDLRNCGFCLSLVFF